jgi:hypothetical protein
VPNLASVYQEINRKNKLTTAIEYIIDILCTLPV